MHLQIQAMPGIYAMAALTILIAAWLGVWLLRVLAAPGSAPLWWLLPGLPLSALLDLLVKRPLAESAARLWGQGLPLGQSLPAGLAVLLFLLAPLTEEAAKMLPLAARQTRALASSARGALVLGVALGLGYGLGEAAYQAYAMAQNPAYARLPWFAFGGYLGERVAICFAHGVLTAVALAGWQTGPWRRLATFLAAAALHALVNAGAALLQLGLISERTAQLAFLGALAVLAVVLVGLQQRAAREVPATT